MSIGYRGTRGYRSRERDERDAAPRTLVARCQGACADTGAIIQPGDLIQRTERGTILVQQSPLNRKR